MLHGPSFAVIDANGYLKTRGATGATGLTGAAGASGRVTLFDSTLAVDTATIDTGAAGIAAGSNNLEITILARSDEVSVGATCLLRVNADAGNNYDRQFVRGDNVTASASNGNAEAQWGMVIAGASCAANVFSVLHLWIPCYTNTVAYKSGIITHARVDTTVANSRAELQGCLWRSTAAITRFSMTALATKKFLAGSRLLIVGV